MLDTVNKQCFLTVFNKTLSSICLGTDLLRPASLLVGKGNIAPLEALKTISLHS